MRRDGIASNFARLIEAHGGLDMLDGLDRPEGLDMLAVVPGGSRLTIGIEHIGESVFHRRRVLIAVYHAWDLDDQLVCDPDVLFEVNPDRTHETTG
jgi:hypothetical protein